MGYMLGLVAIPSHQSVERLIDVVTETLRPYSELTEVPAYPVPLNVGMLVSFIKQETDPSLVHDKLRVLDKEKADAMTAEDLEGECEDRLSITLSEFVERFGDNYHGQKLRVEKIGSHLGNVVTDITTNPKARFHTWTADLNVVPFGSLPWREQFPEKCIPVAEFLDNPDKYKQPEYDRAKYNESALDVKADVWTAGLVTHFKAEGKTDEELVEMGFDPTHDSPEYLKSLIINHSFPGVFVDYQGQYHTRYYEDSVGNWLQGDHTTEEWNEFIINSLVEQPEGVIVPVQFSV